MATFLAVLSWLRSPVGRVAFWAAAFFAVVVSLQAWKSHIYQKGRSYERNLILTNIEETQSKEIEQAQRARADADGAVRDAGFDGMRDDPFNRDNHCTDPKGQQCRAAVEPARADQEGGSTER